MPTRLVPCLNPATLSGLPLDDFLNVAARAGFPSVELPIQQVLAAGSETVGARLTQLGLDVAAASGILPAGPVLPAPLLTPEPHYAVALDGLRDRLAAFRRIGCRTATLVINPRCELTYQTAMTVARRRLNALAEQAAEYGVRLAIEVVSATARLSPDLDGAYPFLRTLTDLSFLLEDLAPDVGVCVDSFHWAAAGASAEELGLVSDRIAHVQVADAPALNGRTDLGDDMRLFPGDGVIPWRRFYGALGAEYQGAISVELFNPELRRLPEMVIARRAKAAAAFGWPS